MGNSSSTSNRSDEESINSLTGGVALVDCNMEPVDFNHTDSMYVPAQPPDHYDDNVSISIQDHPPPPLVPPTVYVGCNPFEEEVVVVTPIMDNMLTAAVELMHILILESGCHLNMLPQIMK